MCLATPTPCGDLVTSMAIWLSSSLRNETSIPNILGGVGPRRLSQFGQSTCKKKMIFFSRQVQVSSGLDFVVLSTLYWTIKAWSETPWRAENVAIANEQMSWLHDRLSDAQQNGRKVVVIGHVGPG